MPSEKRERQRANREQARVRRKRDEQRARLRRNVVRFGGVAVAVIAVGFFLSRGSDEPASTTAPAAATTVAQDTTPPAASETTAPADTTETTSPTDTTQPTETTPPGDTTPTGDAVATAEYEAFRALPVACGGQLPAPARQLTFSEPEDQGIDPGSEVRARLVTSCGEIVLLLDPAAAPSTVNSFVFLARSGYYDGTVSHRIVPGFVYQAGDPTATGSGGPGYQYEDELPPSDFAYTRGTLAMANAGPNTNGSQFFIVFQDTQLPPDFTVFGRVESGLDVLDRIEAVPVINQQPQEGVFIEGIVVE